MTISLQEQLRTEAEAAAARAKAALGTAGTAAIGLAGKMLWGSGRKKPEDEIKEKLEALSKEKA
jgi:hypothetical protein